MRPSSTNKYLIPPPGYRFRPPWYTRPEFYVPITVAAFIVGGLAILVSMNLADLKNQAATFDLNKLEQMESASVILDRNNKIFGQIYVENRETIPYEQLPQDLVNAVVSVEDAKFYQHHGYVLSGILRATFKNLVAGHVRQGASTITQQLARNSFALRGKTFRRKLLEILSHAESRTTSTNRRSWSFTSTGFTSVVDSMAWKRRRADISENERETSHWASARLSRD